ncbi:formate--tetrahydrofolate ligase [Georgenia sp. TF02-10]|uniref:polysaccharide biosynthesis tyrosine autokinase n=1 Tax=Georgenia sp. TF02-10 TaxID=2917725 RepID=UPI001FA6FED3|nr:polysaccharide biosynthesis tyrosine autokinase [Georgenia sp. TF02-10]UNX55371.1 formate--tetrahydrofolate ligase [Georgenia sp. TF02-10]
MGELVELSDYLAVLRKRWLGIALVAVAVLAVTAAVTLLTTPLYSAATRVFFSVQGGSSITDISQGSTFTEKQMASYAEVATSPLVLEPVAQDLGLEVDDVRSAVSVTVPPDTVILEITATDPSAETSADTANAVAAELTSAVGQLTPEQADGTEPVLATVMTPAEAPGSPSSPNVPRNLALGLVLGLLLGYGVALLREITDTKVRDERDLAAVTDRPIVATIGYEQGTETQPVFVHDDPLGVRSEAIRRLRTNLQFVDLGDGVNSIVVTSSIAGEGKTTTAINLAVSLADAGARVALVDADLRRPSVAEYMGLEGGAGLTTVLIGRAEVQDVIQPWRQTSVDVLPSGPVPPNPSELLGSRAMTALLEQLTRTYDVVLLDSPPLLPVTDAAVLSRLADGALVVVGADRIHKAQLADSLAAVDAVDARVLGVVLNKVERKERQDYYYYGSYAAESSTPRTETVRPEGTPSTWPGRPLGGSAEARRSA